MLVERATHPDALQTLVDELGDDWIVHGHDITGVRLAEGLTARDAVIRRDVSFLDREVVFGSNEERIRTRLGDEGWWWPSGSCRSVPSTRVGNRPSLHPAPHVPGVGPAGRGCSHRNGWRF